MNADENLGVNKSILGYNLYSYVDNRPIGFSDNTGTFLRNIFKKVCNTVKKVLNKVVGFSSKTSYTIKEKTIDVGFAKITRSTYHSSSVPNHSKPVELYSSTKIKDGEVEIAYGANVGAGNASVGIEASESSLGVQASYKNTSYLNESNFWNSSYSFTLSQSSSSGLTTDTIIEVNQLVFFAYCLKPVLISAADLVSSGVKKTVEGISSIIHSWKLA